jgi:hypothetical protein
MFEHRSYTEATVEMTMINASPFVAKLDFCVLNTFFFKHWISFGTYTSRYFKMPYGNF